MRNAVDLPAMAVLVSALIGGALLGLAGTIMAIPIAATVKVLASRMSHWSPSPDQSGQVPPPETRT